MLMGSQSDSPCAVASWAAFLVSFFGVAFFAIVFFAMVFVTFAVVILEACRVTAIDSYGCVLFPGWIFYEDDGPGVDVYG
jgi:hypothetical protein